MRLSHKYVKRPRRGGRGFTIAEGLIAGTVFLISMIGVGLMATLASHAASTSVLNVELSQYARMRAQEFMLDPSAIPAGSCAGGPAIFFNGVVDLPKSEASASAVLRDIPKRTYLIMTCEDATAETGLASSKVVLEMRTFAMPVDWNTVVANSANLSWRKFHGERVYKHTAYLAANM